MLEKGRLYSLKKDGTEDSLYLNIKNKRFLFGSSEYCTVRIYIDGIFPEHCVLTIGGQGKAYLEPLHPSALTLVNGIKIKHKVCLQDNDVVTIFTKEFQFAYPPNSVSRNIPFDRSILSYSKQMTPAQKFEMLVPGKNLETTQSVRESSVSNLNYIPKKQICIISGDIIKKIPEFLLKFTHQEPVNITYEKITAQEVNSCSDKFLIKYSNQDVEKSPEERRNLALKLYEFISFLKGLLNRNEEYLYVLLPIFESVWKYCIARANEDILFFPIKSLNLEEEITVNKKALQSRILSCTSKNSSLVSDTMLSNGKMDVQKQNQYSSRKMSISYKKRVSLAVKRYHLRKRKNTMVAKAVETLELSGERPWTKEMCREITSGEQDVVLNLEKQQTTRTRRKRIYNKEKKELQDKGNLKTKPGKENIADNSSGSQVTIFNLRKRKQSKENSKNKGKSTQECDTLELSRCQRITRSMAKSRH